MIGAGFIGAEVASSCRSLGLDVTMIEAAPLPLQRVLPSSIGEFIAELHRGHGVDVRLGVGVDALEGGGGGTNRVQRVRLTDGSVIDADVVVAGIGVTPEVGWLDGSGLTLDDGVVCDETCLAADDVVAAGDVARWFNPRYGETMRVEQWENAIEQGGHAARRLLGDTRPYSPWCRGSGAISTIARSSSLVGWRPAIRCVLSTARSRSNDSSPCSSERGRARPSSASIGPATSCN